MNNNDAPRCPKCKSNANVERVKCRCACCPPWECMACESFDSALRRLQIVDGKPRGGKIVLGYEFFDDE